jgi:hypothetical protein
MGSNVKTTIKVEENDNQPQTQWPGIDDMIENMRRSFSGKGEEFRTTNPQDPKRLAPL